MTDRSRIFDKMIPKPDGEAPVIHRTGVVDAVNADGTVDLDLSGVVVEDVSVLYGAHVVVGSVVQVAAWAGDLLVLGRVATSSADLALNEVVVDRVQNLGPNTISTSETIEETATLPIPANWLTYAIECDGSCDVFESGALTGIRVVSLRLRLTNVTGTIIGLTEVELGTVDPNRWTAGLDGMIEGQTATGNVTVNITTQIPADTGQASIDNLTFRAIARRLT